MGAGRCFASIAALGVVCLGAPAAGWAQALERHVAPGASPPLDQNALVAPPPTILDDDRVLAPVLSGLVLIGAQSVEADMPAGAAIEDHGAGVLDFPRLTRRLRPFVGRPLTPRLISRIQAVITDHYRRRDRPFVAVAAPPQSLSAGVLRLRVIEFRLGAEKVKAKRAVARASIAGSIRVRSGKTIDARLLSEDLDWLAHSPFRRIQATFAPGAAVGTTDLTLAEAVTRPWRVFFDYSNSGQPSTGLDRYLVGAQGALSWPPGGFAAYQLTGSRDAFVRDRKVLPLGEARYLSHSGVATLPLAPRQEISLSFDYITSLTPARAFELRQATSEAALTYRFALSNLSEILAGEVSIGAEARRQNRDTLYGGVRVAKASFDIAQAVVGYSLSKTSGAARQSLTATAHYSPGSIDGQNRDLALSRFSNGRVADSRYLYADIDYSILAPVIHGLTYQSTLSAQVTNRPLSDTESLALGGTGAVRGYTLDDGAFDQGVVWRNELRMAPLSGEIDRQAAAVAPFLFGDLGQLSNAEHGARAYAASTGVGAEARLGQGVNGGATLAVALNTTAATRAGGVRLLIHLGARF